MLDRLEAALLEPDLSPIVDVVLSAGSGDPDVYEAASADGRVRIQRHRDGHGWAFETEVLDGADPLADQSVDRFSPLADERDHRYPDRSANAYPFAYEQVAQLFDSRSAPDLVVHIHSKYSRATSQNMDITEITRFAKIKGLTTCGHRRFYAPKMVQRIV